jgi:hypothetical protein
MRWFTEIVKKFGVQAGSDNDGELGGADLVILACQGILALARRDTKGVVVLPAGVVLRVTAADGSLETLRAWTKEPSTDAEIAARLLNERFEAAAQPARRWEVQRGEKNAIEVFEDASPVLAVLVVEGGDKDGDRQPVGPGRREWRLGRGRWHADNRLRNDIVLADDAPWLSKAAAILRREGAAFELESRDQGEYVVVVPRDGTPKRPAMTASGKVVVAVGDRIEFHDGKEAMIALRVEAVEQS